MIVWRVVSLNVDDFAVYRQNLRAEESQEGQRRQRWSLNQKVTCKFEPIKTSSGHLLSQSRHQIPYLSFNSSSIQNVIGATMRL